LSLGDAEVQAPQEIVDVTGTKVKLTRLHKRNVLEKTQANAVRLASNPFVIMYSASVS
jgi:hypothetical protein